MKRLSARIRMNAKRLMNMGLALATTVTTLHPMAARADGQVQRPPQYVVLAFDGSKSLKMWEETRRFAKELTASGKPLKFTYFINAAYYLGNDHKEDYDAPNAGLGKSQIGFGGTTEEVLARVDQTNLAYKEGNEIANHAAGHYDGTKWSESDWMNEFTQFYELCINFLQHNKTEPSKKSPKGWAFDFAKQVTGFRAPQLGHNADMFKSLPEFGITYDTSLTAKPSYWPQKNAQGIWNFPLSSISVAGTAKKTLSMDYNFYYTQTGGKSDAANEAVYEEQMYQSYANYFQQNYNGNRAPINIGHHFSLWNGGAYWKAEQRFASEVCGLPEVKCVTYRELVKFMEGVSPETLQAYKAANFEKLEPITLSQADQFMDVDVHLAAYKDESLRFQVTGRDAAKFQAAGKISASYFVNKQAIKASQLNMSTVRSMTKVGATAIVEARLFRGKAEIYYVGVRAQNVGTDHETFEQIDDGSMIADPAAAHGEDETENAEKYRITPSKTKSSQQTKTIGI